MKWLVLLLLACGGVTRDELKACEAKAKEHVALEGCKYTAISCMEKEGPIVCEAQMDCGGVARTLTETCITLEDK